MSDLRPASGLPRAGSGGDHAGVVQLPSAMHRPLPPSERGIALLLVLLLCIILWGFSAEFAMQVHYESRTARNVTDQLQIENAIDGQLEIMLARLRYDGGQNEIDSYEDTWNESDVLSRKEDYVEVALTTTVFDEQGKLNLRMLVEGDPNRRNLYRDRLVRLLIEFRRDTPLELAESDAVTWAEQIQNYIGKQGLHANIPTPAMEDDRTILVLDELEVLPAVRDRRFSFLLGDQREGDKVCPGLHRYVTIYGDGKVNLNTSDERLLRAFFHKNPELAERIVDRRENPPEEEEDTVTFNDEEETASGNPFTAVSEIDQIEGMGPQAYTENTVDPNADFTTLSSIFSMRIVAETKITRRDELYIVERVPGATEEEPVEGFRFLLHQERTDPLETLSDE